MTGPKHSIVTHAAVDLEAQRARATLSADRIAAALRASGVELGPSLAPIRYRSQVDAWVHRYRNALLMYSDSIGTSFSLTGAHLAAYQNLPRSATLGPLLSDELNVEGAEGHKSLFRKGGLYSSPTTAVVAVEGMIYLAYEDLGELMLGFPLTARQSIPGGFIQVFERGRIYHKAGAAWAQALHGPVLDLYLALGGPRTLGFPLSGVSETGTAELEGGSIYAHAGSAQLVRGNFRRRYHSEGGPPGSLGYPVGPERDIPRHAGPGRYQQFENGTLLDYGSYPSMVLVRPFQLFIGRINTKEADPGPGQGSNDIYLRVSVKVNKREVYQSRIPSSGDWSTGNNIVDAQVLIPAILDPAPGDTIQLRITVFDSDTGTDDKLGDWNHTLTMADGWGLATNDGIIQSGSFARIKSITVAHQPVPGGTPLTDIDQFWGLDHNEKTPSISWSKYSEAFSNVDSDREIWDPTDWLDRGFYEAFIQGIAAPGNCVGFSVEAVYSRKGRSVFSQPLNRFRTWSTLRRAINIRHCYQAGAPAVYWFLNQFIFGNTHDPKDVFERSRAAWERGDTPVICLSQNYQYTGAPHCILPVAWDSSTTHWKIDVSDINDPHNIRTIHVEPDANSFQYNSLTRKGSTTHYAGSSWLGGRLLYIPYHVVAERPRTPVWEAIILLTSAITLFAGETTETTNLTDDAGTDLDGMGARALSELQADRRLENYFGRVPTFGAGAAGGAMYIRHVPHTDMLPPSLAGPTTPLPRRRQPSPERGIVHTLVARQDGPFRYMLTTGLTQCAFTSSVQPKDELQVSAAGVGTRRNDLSLSGGPRARDVRFALDQRLGLAGDRISLTADGLALDGAEGSIDVRVDAGFASVEILPSRPCTPKIALSYRAGSSRPKKLGHSAPIDKGIRLDLSTLLTTGRITSTPITQIGGQPSGPTTEL